MEIALTHSSRAQRATLESHTHRERSEQHLEKLEEETETLLYVEYRIYDSIRGAQ